VWLLGLIIALNSHQLGRGERPIRQCRLFDCAFVLCVLKHNDSGLNFDFMHHFHMKMLLFGLHTLFSKVTLFSLSEVFCGPQICQKCIGSGAPPGPRWESSLVDAFSRCSPLPNPHSSASKRHHPALQWLL